MIKSLIERANGQTNLARIAGCTQAAVHKWLHNKSRPGYEAVLRIEAAELGYNRHDLRPDIYPRDAA